MSTLTRTPDAPREADLSIARPEWDYTEHADAYLARPDYPEALLAQLAPYCGVSRGAGRIVEVGAGTGNMTLSLARWGAEYTAIEPNEAMRSWGRKRSAHLPVRWVAATAERTGLPDASADWIMAAQCFDTFEPAPALRELHRVLDTGGRLTVLWNHRVWENDPTELKIEALINERLGGYSRGVRRVDPSEVLLEQGLFTNVSYVECPHSVVMDADRYVQVWKSVRTLKVQAGDTFDTLLREIRQILTDDGVTHMTVKYTTRSWTVTKNTGGPNTSAR